MYSLTKKRIIYIILFFPRFIHWILLLPVAFPKIWKVPDLIFSSNWKRLLSTAQELHRLGFKSGSTWCWHAIAYANLGQYSEALENFEKIAKPIKPIEDEAYRWSWHAYVLIKLDRFEEAKALLRHTITDKWPKKRQTWAHNILDSLESKHNNAPPIMMQ